jgi:hypothetical protein
MNFARLPPKAAYKLREIGVFLPFLRSPASVARATQANYLRLPAGCGSCITASAGI